MAFCRLCGEPIKEYWCSYCGFENAEILDTELDKKNRNITRKELLSYIDEIGIVGWLYKGVQDEKPIFEQNDFPLLTSARLDNGTIAGTYKTVNAKNGKVISFYLKTAKNQKRVLPQKKLNIPGNHDTIDLSVKINERLKLDVFYHAKNGNSEAVKVFENIKLGETLIPG